MKFIDTVLNRHPLPVSAVIVACGLVVGTFVHDYVVNVVQPRQQASLLARVQGEIAAADTNFQRRRYDSAARAYRYVISAFGDEITAAELGRLHHNLGVSHRQLATTVSQAENLKQAIAAFETAVALRPPGQVPAAYAASQTELGRAHSARAQGTAEDQAAAIQAAVAAYGAALKIYDSPEYSAQAARVNRLLANTYRDAFVSGKNQDNKQMAPALAGYSRALALFDPEQEPKEYAQTYIDLGLAHLRLAEGIFVRTHGNKAVDAFKDALQVFTQARHPRDFGRANKYLGDAYMLLADRGAPRNLSNTQKMRHRYRFQRLGRRAHQVAAKFSNNNILSANGRNVATSQDK